MDLVFVERMTGEGFVNLMSLMGSYVLPSCTPAALCLGSST